MAHEPKQLQLFPSALRLQKIVPEDNQYRYYRLSTQPTLFGNWALVREWGRIGSPGTVRADWHDHEGPALDALAVIASKRASRGYVRHSQAGA